MSDLTAPPTPAEAPVTTSAIEQMLRTALHDLVTVDMVRPLVNAAVEQRFEFTRQQISAIDAAQRTSYEQFNSAANRMQTAADKFQDTARTVSESMGGLKATDTAQAKQINDIEERLTGIGVWMQSMEGRMNKTENAQANLHMDIHGSPTETNRQNVFTAIGQISLKIDDMRTGVNARLDTMESKLDAHDAYIARQRQIIKVVWGGAKHVFQVAAKSIWKNKTYIGFTALVGALLGALAGSPQGVEFIQNVLKVIRTLNK